MEILRQRGVRLIAINDGVDSARGDDDFTPLRRDRRSGTKPHGADRAVTGRAKRRDRTAESRKPNGMGAADERLQGTGRGSCESGIDL